MMKSLNYYSFIGYLLIGQFLWAQNTDVTGLTHAYIGIKDALVADNGKEASEQAEKLLHFWNSTNQSALKGQQLKVWQETGSQIKNAAASIAKTNLVSEQRSQLNALSVSLFAFLKAMDGMGATVYLQYCPMKKAYWLSNEMAIRNPYYGKKMLTCGNIKEILK